MEIKVLENNGIVENYDMIANFLGSRMGGKYLHVSDIQGILEKGYDIYYFASDAKNEDDTVYIEPETGFKIIETCAMDASIGVPLCISYQKPEKDSPWVGCFVGTKRYLYRKYFNYTPEIIDKPSLQDLNYRDIYDNLFHKEIWDVNGNLDYLREYFWALRRKIGVDVRNKNSECYAFNQDATKILFNARLVDQFDNLIHVMADFKDGVVGDVKRVSGLKDLAVNGFERRKLNLLPTKFFHNLSDIFFEAEVDEFDFTDPHALTHVIVERKDRLPEELSSQNVMEISHVLRTSVSHSILMSKTDCKFVVPMYNLEIGKIQFLMPIYVKYGEDVPPTNAVVVDKQSGYWGIRTILKLREAYVNSRLLGNPGAKWLDIS